MQVFHHALAVPGLARQNRQYKQTVDKQDLHIVDMYFHHLDEETLPKADLPIHLCAK